MRRLLTGVALLLALGRGAAAQSGAVVTFRVYPVGVAGALTSTPLPFPAAWLCGQPKRSGTSVNPNVIAIDDPADPTKDCVYQDNGSGPLLGFPTGGGSYEGTAQWLDPPTAAAGAESPRVAFSETAAAPNPTDAWPTTFTVTGTITLAQATALLPTSICAQPYTCTAAPVPQTVGVTTVGAVTDTADSNYLNAVPITTGPMGGTVQSCSVRVGAIDVAGFRSYQFALYTDVNGAMGAFLAKSAIGTLTANAWNTLPLKVPTTPSTAYWAVYNTNGQSDAVNDIRYATSGGRVGFAPQTFSFWPATAPALSLYPRAFSIYCTLGP